MPWNDSWNEHRLYPCAICAFRASAWGRCAGSTPGTPLLIRGFGVRVPGGAPDLTWCFLTYHARTVLVVWAEVGQGMAVRFTGRSAPPGRAF